MLSKVLGLKQMHDPESHVLQWGNFFERQGSMLGWSE